MSSAKHSRLEKLHKEFTETLISALQSGAETPAATLSVIRSFLSDSGIKPVSDSPAHQRLAQAAMNLPFKTGSTGEESPSKVN
jgi:hypothetical protein